MKAAPLVLIFFSHVLLPQSYPLFKHLRKEPKAWVLMWETESVQSGV